MRVLVRLAADRFLALVLVLLLHGVVLSQFSARTTVAAARVDGAYVREAELQRSLARYRLLLEHDDSRGDWIVQVITSNCCTHLRYGNFSTVAPSWENENRLSFNPGKFSCKRPEPKPKQILSSIYGT